VSSPDLAKGDRTETPLKESERRLRTLMDNLPGIAYRCANTRDWPFEFVSEGSLALTGYAPSEITVGGAVTFGDLIHPDDRQRVWDAVQDAGRRRMPFDLEYRIRAKDGTEKWLFERGRFVPPPDEGPFLLEGFITDITESKRTEEHIRQQAALLQKTHDAIIVWDVERGVQFMNPAAEELTGQKLADALGAALPQVLRLGSEIALRAALQEVTAQGAWTGALVLRTPEGKERNLDSRWSLLLDTRGKPRSVLITCNDVTEKKSLEAQYLRAQRLESVGTLASGVAHDLNNVLSPIVMGVDLLGQTLHDPKTRSILAMMQESARRGTETVKQILTFARGTESQRGPVQPRHLIKEIVRLLQQTLPKNIQLYIDCAQEPATVLADPSQLHQVLMNLCVNARDAMPDGGVLFITAENKTLDASSVNIHPKARPVPYVVFKVSDNGIGIPAEILDRIFDPFFTTKPHGKGTGLGLATVLGIVESHSGFVLVESQPGQGATFQVYLPASAPTETDAQRTKSSDITCAHGELVLIVDDEPAILRMTENVLRHGGYLALTSSNASEAVDLYKQNRDRIQAVITDIMMPFTDGRQLITLLKGQNPKLPIIAMSGLATRESKRETLARGACAFLSKPFTADQLLGVLNKAIKPSVCQP
jgi:PAS domain S-box-containing protein